jgi:hypothetical protein
MTVIFTSGYWFTKPLKQELTTPIAESLIGYMFFYLTN